MLYAPGVAAIAGLADLPDQSCRWYRGNRPLRAPDDNVPAALLPCDSASCLSSRFWTKTLLFCSGVTSRVTRAGPGKPLHGVFRAGPDRLRPERTRPGASLRHALRAGPASDSLLMCSRPVRGSDAFQSVETARVHHAARRRGRVAAGGARAAGRADATRCRVDESCGTR